MASRDQIQQTADLLAVVTPNAMIVDAPTADFPLWLDVLDVATFSARLRENGEIGASAHAFYRGGFIQVHTTADVLHDTELPPADSDSPSLTLPVSAVSRLESFERLAKKGAA